VSGIASELRALAKGIESMTMDSPCFSAAFPIVNCCVEHLVLLARHHEANQKEASNERG
jgi:hypothetical protein